MKTCVVLDLETTGFEPSTDQVIEIGVIKFEESKILDIFETLVNPQIAVPPMVTHLTGLKTDDLGEAPFFDDVREKLVNFIGNAPIIGHNVAFDINFLIAKGLHLPNPLYDTLQMSSILLPGLASYSLDTLSRILKISHEPHHRAMADAAAAHKLFLLLKTKIKEIDEPTFREIQKILSKSAWPLKELFAEAKKELPKTKETKSKKLTIKPAIASNSATTAKIPQNSKALTEDQLINFYKPQGPLAATIKDYESRPTQNQLTAKILESFKENKHLIAEAGTGTGKTLAYLLAGLYWSLNHNQKIVISTYTHNLQEQIMEKDIPLLHLALKKIDENITFKVASLKGRKNYLSLKRLELFKEKDFFLDHEVTVLIKILLWIQKTCTGDLQELSLQNKEYSVLDDICCAEHVCPHEDQDFKNGCYLQKARHKAEQAQLIIVNHALLLQDAIADSPLLPEYFYLIVDEAHHLEKVTTESLAIMLSFNTFLKPFERILKIIDALEQKTQTQTQTCVATGKLKANINQLIPRIEIFFGLVGIFMEKNLEPSKFQYQLNLKKSYFDTADWQKIRDSGHSTLTQGTQIINAITALQQNSQNPGDQNLGAQNPDDQNPDAQKPGAQNLTEKNLAEKYRKELKNHLYECEKRIADLQRLLSSEENENQISWIAKNLEGSITLKSVPLNIGTKLQQLIFAKKKSAILTSATLRADNSFQFIREQLSLDESFKEIALPSHFSYPDQVKIIIPEEFPEPATKGYFLSCAEVIENIIKKNGGRTMVLFTSKKALSATYHQIAPKLKQEGWTVLAQHISGGRGKIVEHFKDEPQSCAIFGTDSFWEGVDIKGGDLTCVIMQKLPFDPPSDPIIHARSQKYLNSFGEFQLPRAILKFRQGFGRLIRGSRDTGSIVILDSRITQKAYGRQFIESLPAGIKIQYGPKETLAELLST